MAKKFQLINHSRKTIAYADLSADMDKYRDPKDTYVLNIGKAQIDDKIYTNKGYKILTGYDQ
jgi:hypothetical protein